MDKESERYNRCLEAAKNEIDRQGIHKRINSRNDYMVYLDGCLNLSLVIQEVLLEADRFSRDHVVAAYEQSKERFDELYKKLGET